MYRSALWSRGAVHQVLINEKYIGNNVWNHSSFKLKLTRKRNRPEEWVRADGVFQPIVSVISSFQTFLSMASLDFEARVEWNSFHSGFIG